MCNNLFKILKYLLSIMFLLATFFAAGAEEAVSDLPSVRNKVYKGYYYFQTEESDSTLMLVMNPITVFPPERFKNKKQEQFYWRTVRDVKKALPYAKLIMATLIETYEYIQYMPEKEQQEHLKRMEKELFKQYKPELKKLTLSQGKLLIKLINRECNQSSYSIVKAFLGSFRAGFWNFFAGIFGASLKTEYDPDGKDAMIEKIVILVENGQI